MGVELRYMVSEKRYTCFVRGLGCSVWVRIGPGTEEGLRVGSGCSNRPVLPFPESADAADATDAALLSTAPVDAAALLSAALFVVPTFLLLDAAVLSPTVSVPAFLEGSPIYVCYIPTRFVL